MAVGIGEESRGRLPFHAREPNTIGGESVDQRVEDVFLGGREIAGKFVFAQAGRRVDQEAAGPCSVVQMGAKNADGNDHGIYDIITGVSRSAFSFSSASRIAFPMLCSLICS